MAPGTDQQQYDHVQKEKDHGNLAPTGGSHDAHHHNTNANNSHVSSCPYPHQRHNPKELHTAESIMEYMNDRREEEEANHQAERRQTEFKNYLEAQRHLKTQTRRRTFVGGLQASQQGPTNHTSIDEEYAIPEATAAGAHATAVAAADTNNPAPTQDQNRHRRATLQAMSILGRRQSAIDTAEWEAFLHENHNDDAVKDGNSNNNNEKDGDDQDENDGDESYQNPNHRHKHSLSIPWYCRPVQRQRWDDDQVLPHINWGDLFFDLFYVAAAYNLGGMLISSMNGTDWPRGVLYFMGIFGGLYNAWEHDVVYSSRYTLVDYAHRLVAVMRFFCVSFAVLSIKPITFLGDKGSVETFCLVLSLFCESVIQLGLHIELYYYGDGDRQAIQNHTFIKMKHQFLPASVTYMAATIIAGVSFFQSYDTERDAYGYDSGFGKEINYTNGTYSNSTYQGTEADDDHHRVLAEAAPSGCASHDDDGHRFLAGGEGDDDCGYPKEEGIQWSIADVPLLLCTAIYVINILATLYRKHRSVERQGQDIREHFVPNNIDYMIHRYGEWIMYVQSGQNTVSCLHVEAFMSAFSWTFLFPPCNLKG